MEALIELLATVIGPPLARLVAAGLDAWALSIRQMNAPVTTAGVVMEIINGVNADHPDWSGAEKRQCVYDAVVQYLESHGATPNAASVNALIELGVQAALGGGINPTAAP